MHLHGDPPAVVQCPRCRKWWKPGNVSCAVLHRGDGCCHYGDTEVPEPYLFSLNPPPPVPCTDGRPIHDADG